MGFRKNEYKTMYISGVDNLVRDFYIPTLKESVLYRRRTGYFNSRALAMAARGISGLLKNDGEMLLLCSVQLDEPEEAVFRDPEGYLNRKWNDLQAMLEKPYDELEKKRFALLAELLARGKLKIKVAVPRSGGIYHEKVGIFTDENGEMVAFSGSGNETPGGWLRNTESFHTYTSYEDKRHINPEIEVFNRLWNDTLPGTRVYELTQAIHGKLIDFRKYYKEGIDEPIDPTDWDIATEKDWQWTPKLAYVFEAGRLWNHADFAYGETAVKPYEHQDHIAATVLDSWPPRYLLCDEVGLGKTIEAGLCIKGFIASGRVDRLLILAPASVLKQWQQEMKTKFNLEVWRLGGKYCYGPQLDPLTPPERRKTDPDNPFRTCRYMLVSSQLLRLRDRQKQLLELEFDLVVLDEAHHARGGWSGGKHTRNRLLELMEELRYHTQGLLMLTATPIQINRKELWDLLNILELPGRWQDVNSFDLFFRNINSDAPDWSFLFTMARSALDRWDMNEGALDDIREMFRDCDVHSLFQAVKSGNYRMASQLTLHEKDALKQILYALTPIKKMVFRNSRNLLKEYKKKGKFSGDIAERDARKIQIEFQGCKDESASERGIYHRIKDYVRNHYARYQTVNKGLGFIMVVYRKRLTSSFKAVELSLERRKEKIERALETGDWTEVFPSIDDYEEDDLVDVVFDEFEGVIPDTEGKRKQLVETVTRELEYIKVFLNDLAHLTTDTKLETFQELLRDIQRQGSKRVIVFSQYADTVTFLLEHFRPIYGDRVGSYTGAGGSYWTGSEWKICSKQAIQEKFADETDPLSLLFCTDAASEGLNLQSCHILFNYDIPWNPMRIEQRIGRVDRIGQKSPTVFVHTLTYAESVEEKAYNVCEERIQEATTTLGYIQPILEPVNKVIKNAALARTDEEEKEILEKFRQDFTAETVAELSEQININKFVNHYAPRLPSLSEKVPFSHQELNEVMTPVLTSHGWKQDGSYFLKRNRTITFDPKVIDQKGRPAKLVTPTTNIGELFKNLPPIPEEFSGPLQTHRVMAARDVGYAVRMGPSYHLVRKLQDFDSPTQEAYPSLESLQQGLEQRLLRRQKEFMEENHKAWNHRYESWKVKVTMYLERLAYFRWREITGKGGLAVFERGELERSWHEYISRSDRPTLKYLVDVVKYEPDFEEFMRRKKKKGRKRSPRTSEQELRYRRDLEMITENIRLYEKELKVLR